MATGSIALVESEPTNVTRPAAIEVATPPAPDEPTVTASGERIGALIDGVRVRQAVVQSDERGSLTEMYSPAWGFTDEPVVYVYQATIRPGIKKGWIVHLRQDDRLFFDDGAAKVALYDARTDSPTKGMVNELFVGSANRALLRIPAGVFHGVVNVGERELRYVNMPTRPYLHDQPDKRRLPPDTDVIPYRL
jgi:dTDP-4-dehydrorhamnose 3,5-epimerase